MSDRYKTALGMRFKVDSGTEPLQGADEFESVCASIMAALDAMHSADPAAATDLAKRLAGMLPPTQQGKTARDGDLLNWVYSSLERGIK